MIDKQSTIENAIITVLALIVIAITLGALYAFVRAIFLFIFSQGKEDQIKASWNSIRYMILGIIFTIILLFLFPLVFKLMGLKGNENYNAKNIFKRSGELIKQAINLGNIVKDSQDDMKYRGQFYYDESGNSKTSSESSDYSL